MGTPNDRALHCQLRCLQRLALFDIRATRAT